VAQFKVVRGKGGRRTVVQVNTGEEGALAHNKALREAHERLEAEKRRKPVDRKDPGLNRPINWDPCPAYVALATELHKRPAAWAEKFVRKLENTQEVDRIRLIEESNPKYNGGRSKIFEMLDERMAELDPATPPPPPEEREPEPPETTESPCPHCDFKAGSAEGLAAHLESNHADQEL
jgi:hypothetical protein